MPEFIAVRCSECCMFQVIQLPKSKKFSCRVCSKKQSVRKIYVRAYQAKEIRPIVQDYNMRCGRQREMEPLPEESAATFGSESIGYGSGQGGEAGEGREGDGGGGGREQNMWACYLNDEEEDEEGEGGGDEGGGAVQGEKAAPLIQRDDASGNVYSTAPWSVVRRAMREPGGRSGRGGGGGGGAKRAGKARGRGGQGGAAVGGKRRKRDESAAEAEAIHPSKRRHLHGGHGEEDGTKFVSRAGPAPPPWAKGRQPDAAARPKTATPPWASSAAPIDDADAPPNHAGGEMASNTFPGDVYESEACDPSDGGSVQDDEAYHPDNMWLQYM